MHRGYTSSSLAAPGALRQAKILPRPLQPEVAAIYPTAALHLRHVDVLQRDLLAQIVGLGARHEEGVTCPRAQPRRRVRGDLGKVAIEDGDAPGDDLIGLHALPLRESATLR